MKRDLKKNDIVYTPCTNFSSGETYFEERKVKEIGDNYIVLIHIATLRRDGDDIIRYECKPTEHKGDKEEKDYYSRPFIEIVKEFQELNRWFCNKLLSDAKKYQ